MRSSEQITVGALAIKEVTRYGGFFDSIFSQNDQFVLKNAQIRDVS